MHFKERTALRYGEKSWIVLFRKILKSYFFPKFHSVHVNWHKCYGHFRLSRPKAARYSLKLTRFIRIRRRELLTQINTGNGHCPVSRFTNPQISSSLFPMSQLCAYSALLIAGIETLLKKKKQIHMGFKRMKKTNKQTNSEWHVWFW